MTSCCDLKALKNMSKILVTGGAGFIGSNLVDKLIELGHEVIVIDNLSSGKQENVNQKAQFFPLDIRNRLDDVVPLPKDIDYIFHLAAVPRVPYSVEHPIETHDNNVNGTLNVLKFARDCNVKKVIFASSSSVYGDQKLPLRETAKCNPVSPYALHKYIGERYMRLFDELYGVPTVSLRFFNVYGTRCDPNSEYSLVIGKFLKMKAENKPFTIFGDGEQSRDFTYVSDVVAGCIATIDNPVHNEVINLCNGKATTLNKIAELIGGEKQYLPVRKGDILHTLGDNKKAKKLLNWKGQVSIEEGIEKMKLSETK